MIPATHPSPSRPQFGAAWRTVGRAWSGLMAAEPVGRTRRSSWAPNLTVLQGIDRGRLWRNPLFGDLGPWQLDDRVVSSWSIAVLVLRGLVCLDISACGCPRLTVKGRQVLYGSD